MSVNNLRIDRDALAPRGRARQRYGAAVLKSHDMDDPLRDELADSLGVHPAHQHDGPERSQSMGAMAAEDASSSGTPFIDTRVHGHPQYQQVETALNQARSALGEAERRTERSLFDALPADAPPAAYDAVYDARDGLSALGNSLQDLEHRLADKAAHLQDELDHLVGSHDHARRERSMQRATATMGSDDTADASSNAFYSEFLGGMADHRSHQQLHAEVQARIGALAAEHTLAIQSTLEHALAKMHQIEASTRIQARAHAGGTVDSAGGGSIADRIARLNTRRAPEGDQRRSEELYDLAPRGLVWEGRKRFE